MPLLNEVEVIVDLVNVQLGGQLVKVKGDVWQVECVVLQGALALTRKRHFLTDWFSDEFYLEKTELTRDAKFV